MGINVKKKNLCYLCHLCALYMDKQNFIHKSLDCSIFNIFLRSSHCHLANKIEI